MRTWIEIFKEACSLKSEDKLPVEKIGDYTHIVYAKEAIQEFVKSVAENDDSVWTGELKSLAENFIKELK